MEAAGWRHVRESSFKRKDLGFGVSGLGLRGLGV